MTINRQKSYKEIFETYLSFSPHYRRNLIALNDMYRWLDDIDLRRKFFSNKYDFFILMEWFNAIGLIRPLAVLSYPPETFKDAQFTIRANSSELDQLYKDGLISFPEDIYNLTDRPTREIKPWEHRVYKPLVEDENDYSRFIEYDIYHYLYHPIQFFQLVTYLRGSIYQNLRNKKEYKKFYWTRRFIFEDSGVEDFEKYLRKKNLTKDQYIKQELDKGTGFNQIEAIIFRQQRWLIEKALFLWIKFESFYHTEFLSPSNSREINIELQISLWDSNREDKYEKMFQEYNEWCTDVWENFSKYFSVDDYTTLKGFIQWSEIHLNFDGLDSFKDLFLLINNEKKSKLKGFMSFYVNILQIVKTLRFFSEKFIKVFPELENEKHLPKWYEPRYFFEEGEEKKQNDYLQKVYLEYGLTQKDTYLLYVEGPTEVILLEDWLDLVYYRTKVKVSVKTLTGGKSGASVFEYLTTKFDANEHFLILDQDTPEYAQGKKDQLKGKGISEESFYIFSPDFVTANFEPVEIIEALKSHFSDISAKIYEATRQRKNLTKSDLANFKELLENKEEFDKYEELVENFLSRKLQNPAFELKKTAFARQLLTVMRKEFSQIKRNKIYPFEEIIGKFITIIQKKKYPGLDIDL